MLLMVALEYTKMADVGVVNTTGECPFIIIVMILSDWFRLLVLAVSCLLLLFYLCLFSFCVVLFKQRLHIY